MANTATRFYAHSVTGINWFLQNELKFRPRLDYGFVGADDNPRTVAVTMWVTPSKFRAIANKAPELSMAAQLDGDQSIRIARARRGLALLEIPKPETMWFNLSVSQLPQRGGLRVNVGLDQQRHPSGLDFASPQTPHLLIAGGTGGGKTNSGTLLIRHCAAHNSPAEVRLILFDVEKRGLDWGGFARLPHLLHPPVYDYGEAKAVLAWLVGEIGRRQLEQRTTPHIFLFIDEWQDMAEADDGFITWVAKIARMGRSYNVHLVLLVQNPTVGNVGHTDIVRNVLARLVARVDSDVAAKVATGHAGSGAHQLTGKGDELLVQPGQEMARITVPLVRPGDIDNLPRTDYIGNLPLATEAVEDPDRVEEKQPDWPALADDEIIVGSGEPLKLDHLAYALATNKGITHLAQRLGISANKGGKAYRLRAAAETLRQKMLAMGYTIIPAAEDIPDKG